MKERLTNKIRNIKDTVINTAVITTLIPQILVAYPEDPPRKRLTRKEEQNSAKERAMRVKEARRMTGVPFEGRLSPITQFDTYKLELLNGVHEDELFRIAMVESDDLTPYDHKEIGKQEMHKKLLGIINPKGDEIHKFTNKEVAGMLRDYESLMSQSSGSDLSEDQKFTWGKALALEGVLEYLGQLDLVIEINLRHVA